MISSPFFFSIFFSIFLKTFFLKVEKKIRVRGLNYKGRLGHHNRTFFRGLMYKQFFIPFRPLPKEIAQKGRPEWKI